MKKIQKIISGIVVAVALVGTLTSPVNAMNSPFYVSYPGLAGQINNYYEYVPIAENYASTSAIMTLGYYDADITLDSSELGASYKKFLNSAVDSWNDAQISDRTVSISSKSDNKIYSGAYADTWLGLYSPIDVYPSSVGHAYHRTKEFSIHINTRTQKTSYVESTICHEIGHAFGLDDISDNGVLLMDHNRDRTEVVAPTSGDIKNAILVWGMQF